MSTAVIEETSSTSEEKTADIVTENTVTGSKVLSRFLLVIWFFSLPFCLTAINDGYSYLFLNQGDPIVFLGLGAADWMPAGGVIGSNNSAFFILVASFLCLLMPLQHYLAISGKGGEWHGALTDAAVMFGIVMFLSATTYFGGHSLMETKEAAILFHHTLFQSVGTYAVFLAWIAFKAGNTRMSGKLEEHKEWSARLLVMGLGAFVIKIMEGWWSLGNGFGVSSDTQLLFNSWAFFLIPLVVVEILIRRNRAAKPQDLNSILSWIGIAFVVIGSLSYYFS